MDCEALAELEEMIQPSRGPRSKTKAAAQAPQAKRQRTTRGQAGKAETKATTTRRIYRIFNPCFRDALAPTADSSQAERVAERPSLGSGTEASKAERQDFVGCGVRTKQEGGDKARSTESSKVAEAPHVIGKCVRVVKNGKIRFGVVVGRSPRQDGVHVRRIVKSQKTPVGQSEAQQNEVFLVDRCETYSASLVRSQIPLAVVGVKYGTVPPKLPCECLVLRMKWSKKDVAFTYISDAEFEHLSRALQDDIKNGCLLCHQRKQEIRDAERRVQREAARRDLSVGEPEGRGLKAVMVKSSSGKPLVVKAGEAYFLKPSAWPTRERPSDPVPGEKEYLKSRKNADVYTEYYRKIENRSGNRRRVPSKQAVKAAAAFAEDGGDEEEEGKGYVEDVSSNCNDEEESDDDDEDSNYGDEGGCGSKRRAYRTPKPYCVGLVEGIEEQGSGEHRTVELRVRKLYRPEDTALSDTQAMQEPLNKLYWSSDFVRLPASVVVRRCRLCTLTPALEHRAEREWAERSDLFFVDTSRKCARSGAVFVPMSVLDLLPRPLSSLPPVLPPELEFFPERPLQCLELFSGCGGLSLGLCQSGAAVAKWAIELDQWAAESYRLNNPETTVFCDDCNTVLANIIAGKKCPGVRYPEKGEVELIVGGPPCQGYSALNRYGHRKNAKFRVSYFVGVVV